jgi:photosystem II stability/assembly factor-like uncharacterized protein
MRRLIPAVAVFAAALHAQWTLQDSHSTASLRGIHSLGAGIAWASGTRGSVLRTTDGGATWQPCSVPPNAEKLDFRGIQAFDANTAIAMSSGKGDASRVYKTTDACRTWKLVFSDPDETGFFDAIRFSGPDLGALVGDPVRGRFPIFITTSLGDSWQPLTRNEVAARGNQSLFAASNTSLLVDAENHRLLIVTGGGVTSVIGVDLHSSDAAVDTQLDLSTGEAAGAFSIASRDEAGKQILVVVGGDYKKPDQTTGTACYSGGDGKWHAAVTPPHGYRSAVAYDAATKSWIAVGPNGTDVSKDDGHTWTAADGGNGEAGNWNALSLPFAVGPGGRIGKLKP